MFSPRSKHLASSSETLFSRHLVLTVYWVFVFLSTTKTTFPLFLVPNREYADFKILNLCWKFYLSEDKMNYQLWTLGLDTHQGRANNGSDEKLGLVGLNWEKIEKNTFALNWRSHFVLLGVGKLNVTNVRGDRWVGDKTRQIWRWLMRVVLAKNNDSSIQLKAIAT